VYVLLQRFGWTDLGTWDRSHMSDKGVGGGRKPETNAENVFAFLRKQSEYVALPQVKLAVVEGLWFLIAESAMWLLICKKDEEARIRQFVNDDHRELR
jgi:mannose-1-phosphate guanylyltransferase